MQQRIGCIWVRAHPNHSPLDDSNPHQMGSYSVEVSMKVKGFTLLNSLTPGLERIHKYFNGVRVKSSMDLCSTHVWLNFLQQLVNLLFHNWTCFSKGEIERKSRMVTEQADRESSCCCVEHFSWRWSSLVIHLKLFPSSAAGLRLGEKRWKLLVPLCACQNARSCHLLVRWLWIHGLQRFYNATMRFLEHQLGCGFSSICSSSCYCAVIAFAGLLIACKVMCPLRTCFDADYVLFTCSMLKVMELSFKHNPFQFCPECASQSVLSSNSSTFFTFDFWPKAQLLVYLLSPDAMYSLWSILACHYAGLASAVVKHILWTEEFTLTIVRPCCATRDQSDRDQPSADYTMSTGSTCCRVSTSSWKTSRLRSSHFGCQQAALHDSRSSRWQRVTVCRALGKLALWSSQQVQPHLLSLCETPLMRMKVGHVLLQR